MFAQSTPPSAHTGVVLVTIHVSTNGIDRSRRRRVSRRCLEPRPEVAKLPRLTHSVRKIILLCVGLRRCPWIPLH